MALIASRRIAQKAVRAGNTGVHSAVGNLPDALLAAGQIIKSDDKTKASSGNGQDDWKQQAWAFLDQVGELSYVCRWLANGLSRCTIKASDLFILSSMACNSSKLSTSRSRTVPTPSSM